MGVAVGHFPALALNQLHDHRGGGFAHVVDVLLVGHPQHQHAAAAQGLAEAVKPKGLVAAASITSKMSMPMPMKPIFAERS